MLNYNDAAARGADPSSVTLLSEISASSWYANPGLFKYWSVAFITEPLRPLAEECKTSYIGSIA